LRAGGAMSTIREVVRTTERLNRGRASPRDGGGNRCGGASAPADAEIEIGVHQVKLAPSLSRYPNTPRALSVRVESRCVLGPEEPPLETRTVHGPSGTVPTRFDFSERLPLNRGDPSWARLGLALSGRPEASDLLFVLRDPVTGKTLGNTSVNLRKLLDSSSERHEQTVSVRDAAGISCAELTITVKALDALMKVDKGETSSPVRAPGSDSSRCDRDGGGSDGRLSSCGGCADAEVEVVVVDMRLQLPRGQLMPRRVAVKIEALGMEEEGMPLETGGIEPASGAPLRFDWSHTLPLRRGGRAWEALGTAVRGADPQGLDLYFVLVDPTTGDALGEAPLSLKPLLDFKGTPYKFHSQQLLIRDTNGRSLAQLNVKVRAFDALRLVSEEVEAKYEPPKRVDDLSPDELHAVLAARGEKLPGRSQQKAWYLELCARRRIRTIEHIELVEATRQGGRVAVRSEDEVAAELLGKLAITVEEVGLASSTIRQQKPRSVAVRVSAFGLEANHEQLVTRGMTPNGTQPMRYNWKKELLVTSKDGVGDRAWECLAEAVADARQAGARLEIGFSVVDASGMALGDAFFDLSPLLIVTDRAQAPERTRQRLVLLDSRQLEAGYVVVSVHALDVLRLIENNPSVPAAATAHRTDSVIVRAPSTMMPGEPMIVIHHGKEYEVPVPSGLRPGQTFKVELPARVGRSVKAGRSGNSQAAPSPGSCGSGHYDDDSERNLNAPGRTRARWGEEPATADYQVGHDSRGSGGAEASTSTAETSRARRQEYDAQRKASSRPVVQPRSAEALSPSRDGQAYDRTEHTSSSRDAPRHSPSQSGSAEAARTHEVDAGLPARGRWGSHGPLSLSMPSTCNMSAQAHAAASAILGRGGGVGCDGTVPTEVEHALIVAFERLGQANAQMQLQRTSRAKLERDLSIAREHIQLTGKQLRRLTAERNAQVQLINELSGIKPRSSSQHSHHTLHGDRVGATARVGGMRGAGGMCDSGAAPNDATSDTTLAAVPIDARGYTEQLRRRLGRVAAMKDEEVQGLERKLIDAHEVALLEAKERERADRQSVDSLRRLSEVSALLDTERRHSAVVAAEREWLQSQVAELQFALQEQAILLESEQQMRYAHEDQLGVADPHQVMRRPPTPSLAGASHVSDLHGAPTGAIRANRAVTSRLSRHPHASLSTTYEPGGPRSVVSTLAASVPVRSSHVSLRTASGAQSLRPSRSSSRSPLRTASRVCSAPSSPMLARGQTAVDHEAERSSGIGCDSMGLMSSVRGGRRWLEQPPSERSSCDGRSRGRDVRDPRESARIVDRYAQPNAQQSKAARTIQKRFRLSCRPRNRDGRTDPERCRDARGTCRDHSLPEGDGLLRDDEKASSSSTVATFAVRRSQRAPAPTAGDRHGAQADRQRHGERCNCYGGVLLDRSLASRVPVNVFTARAGVPPSPAISHAATSLSATIAGSSRSGSLDPAALDPTVLLSPARASLTSAAQGGARGAASKQHNSERHMAHRMKEMALDIEAALTTKFGARAAVSCMVDAARPLALAFEKAVKRRDAEENEIEASAFAPVPVETP